jgi:hypothetical protein
MAKTKPAAIPRFDTLIKLITPRLQTTCPLVYSNKNDPPLATFVWAADSSAFGVFFLTAKIDPHFFVFNF